MRYRHLPNVPDRIGVPLLDEYFLVRYRTDTALDCRGALWNRIWKRGYVAGEAHMPGDPDQCRLNAARCLALAERAWRPEVRQAFIDLAQTWKKLAAEIESDQALFRAISEMEFGEPYEALPFALKLSSRAA